MRQKIFRLILWIFIFGVGLHFAISAYRIMTTVTPDFTVYYTAALRLVHGISVYDPRHVFTNFGYPPITALVFVPFVLFPYQLAQTLFFFMNACAFFASIWFAMKLVGITWSWKTFLLIASLAFLSFPTKFTFGMGQDNYIAYALLLGGVFFTIHKKSFLPVLFVSIAFIAKPILAICLLYFMFTKKWKIVIFVCAFIVLVTIATSIFTPKGFTDIQHYLFIEVPKLFKESGGVVYYNQSLASLFARIGNGLFSVLGLRVAEVALLVAGACAVCIKKQSVYGLAILVTLLPLIDSYSWQHHFIFLLFPFVYAGNMLYMHKKYLLLTILSLAYILVAVNIKNPAALKQFPQSLFLSHVTAGTLLLLFILLSLLKVISQKSSH